jgi:diguanylate cyclase (GGDEF)-like protein
MFRRLALLNPARLAWYVLVAGLAVSLLAFGWLRAQAQQALEQRLQAQSREARDAIEARLRSYADVLQGLSAFFHGSDQVSRADFQRFARSLDLPGRYPGLQFLSFTELVPHARRTAFEQAVRADTSLQPQGYPEFRVHPEVQREAYYVVKYIEPAEGQEQNLGFDLASDWSRRAPLEQARDSGRLAASARVRPIGDTMNAADFQLRLPVYRVGLPLGSMEQRRAAFLGVVGAALNVHDFMASTLTPDMRRNLRLRIHDGGLVEGEPLPPAPYNLLYDSTPQDHADPAASPAQAAVHTLALGGRCWTLWMRPTDAFLRGAPFEDLLPWTVLGAGAAISLLMFALVRALAGAHSRAAALAAVMTRELRHREADLAEAQRVARLGSWCFDVDAERFHASEQAQRLLGAPGLERLHPADRAHFNQRLREAAADGAGFELELRLWAEEDLGAAEGGAEVGSAEQHWLHAIVHAERDTSGRVRQLRGTLMDISARKHGELRLAVEHATTRLLAECDDEVQALQQLFHTWCETLDWQAATHWQWDGGTLRRAQHWALPGCADHAPALPGEWVQRAWQGGEPVWNAQAHGDAADPGTDQPARSPLPGALAVPVAFGGAVAGVLEFRRSGARAPDAGLVALARTVGTQFGQLLQRRRAEQELLHAAHHDPLTGVLNRGVFVAQLEHAIERCRRARSRLAVCFIDLDRFKAVNDTLGHGAGDQLLCQAAARLRETLRQADLVARHGGDEFVVLAEDGAEAPGLEVLARKLVAALDTRYLVQGHECPITASVGVAVFPDDGQDAATLLRHADIAMYRAKEAGKNRYAFFAARMDAQAQRRLGLQAALHRTLERRELTLAYQPKVALADGRVTGVEALARWTHAQWGAVSPAEFIPLAEDTGLIGELGRFVLAQALADAAAWSARLGQPLPVAVNLSASQFADDGLLAQVRQALQDSGAAPSLLELELTESMVMREPDEAARLLGALRALGVRVSIDDFGTGHSSLAYLKRLPLDAVKLDRSFVRDLPEDRDDAAIAAGVIALAHQLRLAVVAEGVETQAQADFLRAAGCDQAQGFGYSRPLPVQALVAWIEAWRPGTAPAAAAAR